MPRLLSLLLSTLLAGAALAAPPANVKPPFPQLRLLEVGREGVAGQRAVEVLGSRLPEVAAWYGKSPEEFANLLQQDKRMRLDARGRVFFVEELEQPLAASSPTNVLDGTLAPLDQTFALHSRPGAARTIYLNFKGATLSGTAWNSSGTAITAPPFDLDGIPGSFNTSELQRIQTIWQRVAEDYAPFDVNVTTEAPPPEALTRSGSTDTVFGTTVLITTRAGVYSCSCGGVAYLGIFDDTSDFYKPALVFYDALGSGNEKYVAEAISHEAGHNMGLNHDGSATAGYYQGHGSGATGWAPIMGVGYYQALVQWNKGEYSGANNVQDDYVVMQGNGLPLRADDHGDSAATATPLPGVNGGGVTSASATGVIERPTDVDVFSFNAGAGPLSLTLSPAARSPNLDALLTLRDAAGTVLASINPTEALNASASLSLPSAGTYTLWVQGTGKGDPLGTGYTSYGSLGNYQLSASYTTPIGSAPTAQIGASTLRGTAPLTVNFSGAGSSDPDGSIVAYDWQFGDGSTAGGVSSSHSYTQPGSYSAQLRVTDNSGLSASSAVTITVDAPVVLIPMRVADIAMYLQVARNGQAKATAMVKVLNGSGQPVAGAVVTGNWSGIVSRTGATATTTSNGVANLVSPNTRSTSGSFVFTVTGVSLAGYAYQPATNTETSDAISR
ncbi:PKD domain-containing protein [Inhella proteolytica]|uniref:PKD domain-containing protein n=1 Tax=Inhella proteolytica TaxID=2795029 RepID=A0A931J034_9BURK|nr:PKD domain-containing protein [Inhella proteolytica]MBH9576233.1 PKD domain-containing protein [Inhella proteolytica]